MSTMSPCAAQDKTRRCLSFKGQTGSGEGLLVTSNQVVLEAFAVEDSKGDGVKAKGSDQITFRDLRVEWTNGPDEKNGAYGVYPVSSKNVLVDGVTVKGAADAGIYVGQSENIVVRNSRAEYNVAGIEIENSMKADVYKNVATHNTGGILVFDLPNLPVQGGHDIRVFDNDVVNNDTANFAPKGNTVAMVPKGMGIMVMANRNVHVFNNKLDQNGTTHVLIAAYPNDYEDDNYMFVPRGVSMSTAIPMAKAAARRRRGRQDDLRCFRHAGAGHRVGRRDDNSRILLLGVGGKRRLCR
jgi:parallel beta-helix repeat protein